MGDEIVITFYPSKVAAVHAGVIAKAVLADGKEVCVSSVTRRQLAMECDNMRRHYLMNLTIALFVTLSLSSVAFAQAKFDARDLTGVWQREGDRGVNPKVPEMTPEGLKKFNENKPSYGRPLGRR